MDEKKKVTLLLGFVLAIILLIVGGTFYENHKSEEYLKDFYTAFEGSDQKLVMIGRDNCSWCQLFKPTLDSMSKKYGFEYIYVNTNELTTSSFNKLLKKIGVDKAEFGTPLTVIVKDKTVVDSIPGYVDDQDLFDFLKDHEFVSTDAKLSINYVDYEGYKKVVKSDEVGILVIGQTSCSYCIKAKPILSQIVDDKNVKINFLNITKLSDEERGKFTKYLDYFSEHDDWGTPLTLIVKNGKVLDYANGLLDYDGYVTLFEKNGLIK